MNLHGANFHKSEQCHKPSHYLDTKAERPPNHPIIEHHNHTPLQKRKEETTYAAFNCYSTQVGVWHKTIHSWCTSLTVLILMNMYGANFQWPPSSKPSPWLAPHWVRSIAKKYLWPKMVSLLARNLRGFYFGVAATTPASVISSAPGNSSGKLPLADRAHQRLVHHPALRACRRAPPTLRAASVPALTSACSSSTSHWWWW